jgi:hypothetical protein
MDYTVLASRIQALASHFDVHICYLHSSELRYIQNAMALLPKNAWLVIEDIDSNNVTHLTGRMIIKNRER